MMVSRQTFHGFRGRVGAIFKTGNGESANRRMGTGNGERGTGNAKRETGNGESLKRGIFNSGNL